jgi:hypothetical protein
MAGSGARRAAWNTQLLQQASGRAGARHHRVPPLPPIASSSSMPCPTARQRRRAPTRLGPSPQAPQPAALVRLGPALARQVLAPGYAALLAEAAKALGPGPAFDHLWPQRDVAEPWQALLVAL